jgi:hypothetical protein
MAQGSSVSFFKKFSTKFDRLCKDFDKQWIQRDRTLNTKILALLTLKLVSGKHGFEITLNDFWCKSLDYLDSLSQPVAVAASSFCEARKKLCSSFFRRLNELLTDLEDEALSEKWLGHRIFCVDGTKVNLPRTLKKSFPSPSPNSYYPQGLVSCLFNLLNKTPHAFVFSKNHNELLAAKKLLPSLRKLDVVVYDRAFLSYAMLASHLKNGLHAVFRVKEKNTLKIVSEFLARGTSSDELFPLEHKLFGKITVRLVSYVVKGKRYCLLTTLIDKKKYPIEKLKDLYHARWGVEEFFKLSKTYLNLENFHSKTVHGIEQEIAAHFVVLHLAQLLAKIADPTKQINRRHAVNQLVQNIEKLFLASTKALKTFLPWVIGIMTRCKVPIRPGRSYIRRSRKPINRWQKNINREWERKRRKSKPTSHYA